MSKKSPAARVRGGYAGDNLRPPQNLKLILNPVAGKGRSQAVYNRLEPFLTGLPVCLDTTRTSGQGHAYELARQAAHSGRYEVIVAMGGDGTVNEVLNGLMTVELENRPALGILPTGRGADFCKATGVKIPADLREAARTLAGHREVWLDAGLATYDPGYLPILPDTGSPTRRYFLNVASLGFDAAVTEQANLPPVGWLRKLAPYYTSIFATMQTYRNKQVSYRLDGQTGQGVFNSLIAANGNYYGSGMKIAPGADPRDGLFEIVLLGDASTAEIVLVAPLFYTGWHRWHPRVKMLSGQKLLVEPAPGEGRLPLQMDGEVVGQAPASFEIIPKAIRLKVP